MIPSLRFSKHSGWRVLTFAWLKLHAETAMCVGPYTDRRCKITFSFTVLR